jgi:hypothetical protein
VAYPDISAIVEVREKWEVRSTCLRVVFRGGAIAAQGLLLEPSEGIDCIPTWRVQSTVSSICPELLVLGEKLYLLRPSAIPSNCIALDPAVVQVSVGTSSSLSTYRVYDVEGSYWGDPGEHNELTAWVRDLLRVVSLCAPA